MESAFEDDITLLDIHSGAVAVRVVAGMTTALLGQRPAAPTDAGPRAHAAQWPPGQGRPTRARDKLRLRRGGVILCPYLSSV